MTDHSKPGADFIRPLRRLNLNLLYALDAILQARTLTEAGHLVSLTQPAMSMALRRLRDHFGDDLVHYRNGERQLTALGEALLPRIGRLLRDVSDAFDLTLDFSPETTEASIMLAAPEPVEITFLAPLLSDLLRAAPGIHISLATFDYRSISRIFEQGVDLAIVPETMIDAGWASVPLFDHEVAGMIWDRHPIAGSRLSLDDYLSGGHAALLEPIEYATSFARSGDPPLSQRRIVVRTGRFSTLPHLVIGTDLIVTGSNWLIQYFAAILPVRLVELPIAALPMRMVAVWSPHRSSEPLIRWLLDRMLARVERSGLRPSPHLPD